MRKSIELEEKNRKIAEFAEKQTKRKYRWKVYCLPLLFLILAVAYISFVALQFFGGTEKGNFVIRFFEWLKTTPFGKENDSVMYIIDGALFAVLAWLFRKLWRNPLNKSKNEQLQADLVQKYISENEIG